jgi:hypothetical protein
LDQLLAAGYSLQEIAKKKDHSEKRRRQENCEWADRKSAALKQLVMVRRASEPVIEAVGGRLDDYESSKDGRDTEDLQRSASLGTIRMEQHSTSSMRTATTTTNNGHNNNNNTNNNGTTTVPGIHLHYRKHAPLPDTNGAGNSNTSSSTIINTSSTSSNSSNTGTPVAKSRNKVHPLSSSPMRNLLHHLKPLPRVIPNFAPPLVQANNKSNKPKQSSSSSKSSSSSSNMGARCA